jgi:hypothetical protein
VDTTKKKTLFYVLMLLSLMNNDIAELASGLYFSKWRVLNIIVHHCH